MQNEENKTENNGLTEMDVSNERVYELGYLLAPTIEEVEVPALYSALKDLIVSFGGEIVSDDMPKMLALAYPMVKVLPSSRNKFTSAYFGWIKFIMDSDKVMELKKKLDSDPKIIRFLILKTVKENTIAGRRFVRGDAMHRRPIKKSAEGETIPINKEEIDKEIEAMVAV